MEAQPHLARLKPLVQDWGENGFGSPSAVYLLYAFKLVVYAGGALLVISTDAGAGRHRRLRRLVDAADRLREVRGLDAALGDPRARGGLDAAQLPLHAADRRAALLAAAGHGAAAAVAGQGAADRRGRGAPAFDVALYAGVLATGALPALRLLAASDVGTGLRSAGRLATRRASPCCSASSPCSACATRSPSSAPGRKSTRRCSRSASSRSASGSSPGSSSSSSSGGAPPPRS